MPEPIPTAQGAVSHPITVLAQCCSTSVHKQKLVLENVAGTLAKQAGDYSYGEFYTKAVSLKTYFIDLGFANNLNIIDDNDDDDFFDAVVDTDQDEDLDDRNGLC